MNRGFVQVYTGDGKGKTTAAIGLAIRAAGAGLKVYFGQFLKGRRCSEHIILEQLKPNITFSLFGTSKFIVSRPSNLDILKAGRGLDEIRKAMFGKRNYDLLIMDEVICAIDLNIIELQDVMSLIINKPKSIELVLTGRNAPPEILQVADLITDFRKIRHYYDKGAKARKGFEF